MANIIKKTLVTTNRKASYDYHFLEMYYAGVVLTGTEVKSTRDGKANLQDAFCQIINNELYIRNMQISPYEYGSYNNHDPKRMRKLLLTRREIKKLHTQVKEAGLTIVPVALFFNERNFLKVELALAKGKKSYDKRETLKEKDAKREMSRKNVD